MKRFFSNKSWTSPSLEEIIQKLIDIRIKPPGTSANLTTKEIFWLCDTVREIFLKQPILLELQPPLTICGDIHGQYHDLLRLFEICKYPPQTDYVDRGIQSIETICLLFAFKIRYSENFFMLRGNHESELMNYQFGFYSECVEKYNEEIWQKFCSIFSCLPIAAIIDDKIFCVHGGISQSLISLDQIRSIQRPVEIPKEGLLCDLLWSDPDPSVKEYEPSDRGAGYLFGLSPLQSFLKRFNFDLVCRAHQAMMDGFDFPFAPEKGCITLFSAANYCYEFNNRGGMMHVREDLYCSFSVLDPVNWEEEYFTQNELLRPGTPPIQRSENEKQPTEFFLKPK